MACNCATTEQINKIYKKYGEKRDKGLTFKEKVKNALMYSGVAIAMVFIFPFLFLYVVYKGVFDDDHKISLTKFFRLNSKKVNTNVG